MLKNMKVGTKLLAVLVAPVIVLLIVAGIGINQRNSVAKDASRVQQLSEMANVDANLANELQLESVYSSAYMGSVGKQWRAQMIGQRQATDRAIATYRKTRDSVNPAKDSPDLRKDVDAVDARLTDLVTERRSVDGIESQTTVVIDQYNSISGALADLNTAIAQDTQDPSLSRGLTTFANLNRLKAYEGAESSMSTALAQAGYFPSTWPTLNTPGAACVQVSATCDPWSVLSGYSDNAGLQETIYAQAATADQKALERNATAGQPMTDIVRSILNVAQVNPTQLTAVTGVALPDASLIQYSPRIAVDPTTLAYNQITAQQGVDGSRSILKSLKSAENTIISQVNGKAQSLHSNAQRDFLLYVLGAGGAIALAILGAFYVARSVTVPLRKLKDAAYILSTDRLPGLVERLRNPEESGGNLSETLVPIDVDSRDEIGQLADAFNSIQHVTVEVAEEQSALLRKGIGDIFINLARRNQTLLDRQIEFIDQLEANEEDPDQLDNLFKLDHLATRMRRNAESLLVLAGAEPPRRRGRPVALADVVRVAIGEVEDFARISLLALDDVTVGGNVAVDLAHLLSELMENATHFSPPDTTVEIVGHRADTGYTISVSDQGIGMSADQLADANSQLARPPLVGLALSRSLGFIVIGRLAARFAVAVKLTSSPSGGVTALVTLPGELVSVDGQPLIAPPVAMAPDAPAPPMAPPPPVVAEAPPDIVVVDAETDAAVAADGQAGREMELEEFDETLAQSDREMGAFGNPVVDDEPKADIEVVEDPEPADSPTGLLDELLEEPSNYLDAVPEGDDFERGLQSLVSDELAPGPVERGPGLAPTEADSGPGAFGAPATDAPAETEPVVPDAPIVTATPEAKAEPTPLTAAGLVKRTPKKRSETAEGGGMSTLQSRTTGSSQRSPEEVRKMLSRYRSGLNKGRGSADAPSNDSTDS